MENLLGLTTPAPLSLETLAINMLIAIIITSIVAWYYTTFGRSLSNRGRLASILPVLAMIVLLIISVVKSSLALSLGLVGALSIVRYRTAVKEPEELMYIFLAIAIGVGLGADQRWPTILAVAIILIFMLVRSYMRPKALRSNLYLNISAKTREGAFSQVNDLLKNHVEEADLRRLDDNEGGFQATYLIKTNDDESVTKLLDSLREQFPDGDFSFVEQDNLLGA
ncbi:MAG: DUF4956 domain-containing protein [Candidatus Promineifilaceae bacterium]|jgi:uncharacterized membrane protein YhiD involved in acid resistance